VNVLNHVVMLLKSVASEGLPLPGATWKS